MKTKKKENKHLECIKIPSHDIHKKYAYKHIKQKNYAYQHSYTQNEVINKCGKIFSEK